MHRPTIGGLVLAALLAGPAFGQGFGHVKGRFLYDGDVPAAPALVEQGKSLKDPQVCAANGGIPDQSLVVDPKTKGIANVFMYLKEAPAQIHPEFAKPPGEPVLFDQKNCTFVPHALVTRVGQGVNVTSSDPIAHNTHTFPIKNTAVNFLLPPKPEKPVLVKADKAEILPIQVKCDIHSWMTSYWLIVDHPYAIVTGEDGSFTIENLPAGEHEFRVWHEKAGYLDRGLKVTVKNGETTDLGDVKYVAKDF